jgi:phosphate transport system permease protein
MALGATQWQTIWRQVLPAAIPGVATGVILALSRAIGETMIVLVAAGQIAELSADPRNPMYTMTSYIAAIGKGDVATGTVQYKTIFAVGMLLFVITLAMNLVAIRFVRKYRQVYV